MLSFNLCASKLCRIHWGYCEIWQSQTHYEVSVSEYYVLNVWIRCIFVFHWMIISSPSQPHLQLDDLPARNDLKWTKQSETWILVALSCFTSWFLLRGTSHRKWIKIAWEGNVNRVMLLELQAIVLQSFPLCHQWKIQSAFCSRLANITVEPVIIQQLLSWQTAVLSCETKQSRNEQKKICYMVAEAARRLGSKGSRL